MFWLIIDSKCIVYPLSVYSYLVIKCSFSSSMKHLFLNWVHWLFHDGGRYHIEASPLIFRVNQWTGFYMITASVMKELKIFKMRFDKSSHRRCYTTKVFFLKETPTQVFSCEYCEIFKKTYLWKLLRTVVSS